MTENKLSRRAALGAAGAIVAGGVAGYAAGRNTDAAKANPPSAGGAQSGGYGSPAGGSGGKALARVDAIPDGGGVIVGDVVVTRTGLDVHAFSATCTHQGCHVNKVSGGRIECPCHFSKFSATTGAVVGGPAPLPLPAVAVTVRNGEVFRT